MVQIKAVEYFRVKPRWLMVKVTDENGEYGWGEATLEGHDLAVEGCLDEMVDRIVGMEAKSVQYSSPCDETFAIRLLTHFVAKLKISGKPSGDMGSTVEAQCSCRHCLESTLHCGI